MRPAATLLSVEAAALRPIIEATPEADFERPTVCDGWTVRDVLGHCGAALTRLAEGTIRGFTPEDNEVDVVERRRWPLDRVLEELFAAYETAPTLIDRAAGAVDGLGLGEWIHGGDVREPLGAAMPYGSEGIELAMPLLFERSQQREAAGLTVDVDGIEHRFGVGAPMGHVRTDAATFVRLTGNRRPDPARYELTDASASDLVLFN